MDRATLLAHREHWGNEPDPTRDDCPRLHSDEAELYDDLRFDRLAMRLRLEQERVGPDWLARFLQSIDGEDTSSTAREP
jgi:hypothetical protein